MVRSFLIILKFLHHCTANIEPSSCTIIENPNKSICHLDFDGKPVGKTPLLLVVQPGVYVVEMEGGPRMAYGRRQVDLLPKEARELLLELQPRYPTSISLPAASH